MNREAEDAWDKRCEDTRKKWKDNERKLKKIKDHEKREKYYLYLKNIYETRYQEKTCECCKKQFHIYENHHEWLDNDKEYAICHICHAIINRLIYSKPGCFLFDNLDIWDGLFNRKKPELIICLNKLGFNSGKDIFELVKKIRECDLNASR